MRRKLFFLLIFVFLLPLLGAGCITVKTSKTIDGGVFRSDDGGETWMQKVFIRQEKKKVISLNIYGKESSGSQDFKKEIRQLADKKDLNADENFYLIFVYFDIIKQDINDDFWVIPSLELQKLPEENNFSKFLINKKDLTRFLIEAL